jgi:hypothetical protein
MKFLSRTCNIYYRESDGVETFYEEGEVKWDSHDYYIYDLEGRKVGHHSNRPAKWWSVAVYTAERAYGGPEEGGWWYDCGGLVDPGKIKVFDNYQEAYDYSQELWKWCLEENKHNKDERLIVRDFTEEMPDNYFPETRPYYS